MSWKREKKKRKIPVHLAQFIRRSKLIVSPAPPHYLRTHTTRTRVVKFCPGLKEYAGILDLARRRLSCNSLGHESSNSVVVSVYIILRSLPQRRTHSFQSRTRCSLDSQIKHTSTTATKIETTEIIVLLTFAFVSVSVSVSGINEGFSLIRDIFFCVVTSPS